VIRGQGLLAAAGQRNAILIALNVAIVILFTAVLIPRQSIAWPDRRPIGALFLADYSHASATNPRGWFNRPELDVAGSGGTERFRNALLEYADRSVAILRQTGSQGMIVWDLEGEQFPQKTSYIGDPRLVERLAPEMAGVVDEFFRRFRDAGLRVGMTIRPQRMVFDATGHPRQSDASDYDRVLLEKIDYARKRWGATLFYIDSNGGILRPSEAFRLRGVARARQDVLLIPEHHDLLYYGFSAPYTSLRVDDSPLSSVVRIVYPHSFRVLNLADSGVTAVELRELRQRRDIALFRGWFCAAECRQLESARGVSSPE
jgi:hypothetical protein